MTHPTVYGHSTTDAMPLTKYFLAHDTALGDDRLLADVLPQIIWICNAQGTLQWVNARWYDLTGLTEHETLHDKGALTAVHPDDRPEVERRWAQAIDTGSATEIEYRIRDRSGEYRWHFARVRPVCNTDGKVGQWVASVLDIHDRRMAEDARRAARPEPGRFFHLSPVPMAITRPSDGAYLFINDAFTRMTGFTREEAIGRTPMDLGMVTSAQRTAAATHFDGGEGRSFELSVQMKDGRIRTLLLINSHVEIGGAECFLNAGVDLTYRSTLEDDLREREARARAAEDALRVANKQKDEFLALLSHELRHPLTPILTSARLLQKRADAEAQRELEVVVQQVKHMSRLVDDLLDIARVTRGAISLVKTRIEVASVLRRAIAATSPLFEQRMHALEMDVADQGLAVEADEVRLLQIFDNLLSNAAMYSPPGGRVRVTGRREGDLVTLRFLDTGHGIDEALLPNLFDSFVQGRRGPDRAEGGLGIGLSLVRALTELHGGTVSVHSDGPGRGSEFTVRLPAASPYAPTVTASRTAAPSEGHGAGSGARLLVVDDHQEVAGGLERLLRVLGYDVRTALDPIDAIAAADAFRPHVALLDIGLPTMDGYRLARELRARLGEATPVLIALTGYNQLQDIERSHASGFSAHLVKPVDVDDLVETLATFGPR